MQQLLKVIFQSTHKKNLRRHIDENIYVTVRPIVATRNGAEDTQTSDLIFFLNIRKILS